VTKKELRELRRLSRKWACGAATLAEIRRCRELETRLAAERAERLALTDVGSVVRMPYDAGAGGSLGGTTLYGRVTAAGPRAVTITWESGLRNRVRREDLAAHGVVNVGFGEWNPFDAVGQ